MMFARMNLINFAGFLALLGAAGAAPAQDAAGYPSRDIIAKLHAESTKALQASDLRDRMVAEGAEFVGDTPEQFTAFIASELVKWGKAARASGAKVE